MERPAAAHSRILIVLPSAEAWGTPPPMSRIVLIVSGVLALLVSACGDGVDRWDGPGCQPACVRIPVTGDDTASERAVCIERDNGQSACLEEGLTNVVCENTGDLPTCDTDDGLPRCLGGAIERPVCSR